MIDTHAHLDVEHFDEDRAEVIKRAFDSGLEYIIIPAIEEKYFDNVIKLAESDDRLFCSMGAHPHNANEVTDDTLEKIRELSRHQKVVAIGEIGLDYHYDFSPPETQIQVFRDQLHIAKQENLPIIVHNRESDDDMIRILKEEQDGRLRGVLHCFSSDEETLEQAISLGFHVSFTGNITFKKTPLEGVVKAAPLDKIMIETDSPYMTPHPNRGKRNEPSYVKFVAEKIAEFKSISIEEVISMTSKTAKELFKLSVLSLLFLFSFGILSAQNDEDEYFDYEEEEEEFVHPYPKTIGIAPFLFGTNTIVDTYYLQDIDQDKDITFEGIAAYGFGLFYVPLDYMFLEANYFYSKNMTLVEKYNTPENPVEPNYHSVIELSTHWTPNPYSRISVFGTIGGTLFLNSYDGVSSTAYGINTGIGFYGNIGTSFGTINLLAEWRLDFALGRNEYIFIEKAPNGDIKRENVEATSFFSIPRFGIVWYPKF